MRYLFRSRVAVSVSPVQISWSFHSCTSACALEIFTLHFLVHKYFFYNDNWRTSNITTLSKADGGNKISNRFPRNRTKTRVNPLQEQKLCLGVQCQCHLELQSANALSEGLTGPLNDHSKPLTIKGETLAKKWRQLLLALSVVVRIRVRLYLHCLVCFRAELLFGQDLCTHLDCLKLQLCHKTERWSYVFYSRKYVC